MIIYKGVDKSVYIGAYIVIINDCRDIIEFRNFVRKLILELQLFEY